MQDTERIYRIDQLLRDRGVVSISTMLSELGVSLATFKRDLAYLRDRLHAPILFDRERGGYRFDTPGDGPRYELPGLWFSEAEAAALVTMSELLVHIDGGLLQRHVEPLRARIDAILGGGRLDSDELRRRICISGVGARPTHNRCFPEVGLALLERRRLQLTYHAFGTDTVTEREVSPQRLVFYRQNWYLDAWCHLREGLRSFALDGMRSVRGLRVAAHEVDDKALDAFFRSGYGIFSGSHVRWAKLRFSAERARWVAAERWHSRQRGHFEDDGRYVLEIPYSDTPELIGDILRHGAEVEVLDPPELHAAIHDELQRALARSAAVAARTRMGRQDAASMR